MRLRQNRYLCLRRFCQLVELPALLAHRPEHASPRRNERFRRVKFHNLTAVEDENTVVVNDGVEAVSDGDKNAASEMLSYGRLDPVGGNISKGDMNQNKGDALAIGLKVD